MNFESWRECFCCRNPSKSCALCLLNGPGVYLTPRNDGDLTDCPEAKLFYKPLLNIAVSPSPEAASAGTSGVVVTEDHCAVLERTNGRYFVPQFKTSVLSSTIIKASKDNGKCWCKT